MSMIKIENLTFSYPTSDDLIFDHVNFQLDTNWKLGFVGRNGRGKTTLMRLLMGEYEYSGRISSSVQFDYFPYPVSDGFRLTAEILEEICPFAQEWEILRELSYLNMEPDVLWRPYATLSHGEQTKVLLAALFLNEGHFLLIDEPTNHLDSRGRDIVASYLKKKKGFILVSHDRRFLDQCVDHILSLNRSTIEVQSGNFSSWMENFERQQASEAAQNERLKTDIRRLRQSAGRTAAWSDRVEASKTGAADKGYVGHKAAKMMKRAKSIEKRQQQAIEQKEELLKNQETAEQLKLLPLIYRSETLAVFSEVSACYDGKSVCSPVSFTVRRGDRIVLEGKNGSGKSSLLKLLVEKGMNNLAQKNTDGLSEKYAGSSQKEHADSPLSHTGMISVGSGLVISYVPQDASWLSGSIAQFAREYRINETLFRAILRKLDFSRTQFEKDISGFSGGQKKKVLIARSLCEQAHLYIWDEPLNFIDIYSRMQIEQLIREFSPAMLIVEHDRAFCDAIAARKVSVQ